MLESNKSLTKQMKDNQVLAIQGESQHRTQDTEQTNLN